MTANAHLTNRCPACGKDFHVKRSTQSWRKYCSYRCRNQGQWGPVCQVFNWACKVCGKEDHLTPFMLSRKVYCSPACMGKDYSVIRRGAAGTNWKGGVTQIRRYLTASNTMRAWCETVLASNNGQCAECDAPAVHAHHIVGVAELLAKIFDPANGLPLCLDCHSVQPDHNTNLVRRPRQAARKPDRPSQIVS